MSSCTEYIILKTKNTAVTNDSLHAEIRVYKIGVTGGGIDVENGESVGGLVDGRVEGFEVLFPVTRE